MSDSNSMKILTKKRSRRTKTKTLSTQKKLNFNKNESTFYKNSKNNLSKNILYEHEIKNKVNEFKKDIQLDEFEKPFPYEKNVINKNECLKISLGNLTEKVLDFIRTNHKTIIKINELANILGAKKRRIYDITNIFEGLGFLKKSGKNTVIWTKKIQNKTQSKKTI